MKKAKGKKRMLRRVKIDLIKKRGKRECRSGLT